MKPIYLNEETKTKLFEKFAGEFMKHLNQGCFEGKSSFTFTADLGTKAKNKIKIVYTPEAYLKMMKLVASFDSEVSWFGLVDRKSPTEFYVYDVLVCKQQVSGAKVDTKDEDMVEFICSLTDEQSDHMHFQAHSHVNFDTFASGTDLQNQEDILGNMPGHEGFYIFQIWNKKGDINTYLYDLDNNVFYDRNDVEVKIDGLDAFIDSATKLVEKKTYGCYYYPRYDKPGKTYYESWGAYGGDYGYSGGGWQGKSNDFAKVPKEKVVDINDWEEDY